jgi:hypothetical protein
VKIVLTSTSQVYVPRIKDLRVIALAWYGKIWCRGSCRSCKRPSNKFNIEC